VYAPRLLIDRTSCSASLSSRLPKRPGALRSAASHTFARRPSTYVFSVFWYASHFSTFAIRGSCGLTFVSINAYAASAVGPAG